MDIRAIDIMGNFNNVSICIAVYNGESFLQEQLESVLSQLLVGDEVIVVNDASNDRSLLILQNINSPLIKVYTNSQNLGVIKSFERALNMATNDIIFLCDQDDIWLKGKRLAFVSAFENHPKATIVISDAKVINANGQITASSFMNARQGFKSGFFSTIFKNRYLGCAMAIRRSVLKSALPIPNYVPMHDMWIGLIGNLTGKVVYISEPFLLYRRHDKNASPVKRQSIHKMLVWRFKLLVAFFCRLVTIKT